jgi:hypothetical protein
MNRDYISCVRDVMRKAAADIVPFDEAYAETDWSAGKDLPAFDASNRGNACRIYLQMEAESFQTADFLSTVRLCIVCLIGD